MGNFFLKNGCDWLIATSNKMSASAGRKSLGDQSQGYTAVRGFDGEAPKSTNGGGNGGKGSPPKELPPQGFGMEVSTDDAQGSAAVMEREGFDMRVMVQYGC